MDFINARREMRGQSGFTLIELLVVIAILGILAGVVVFAVGGIANNGDAAACDIDQRTLKTAAEAYRAENGSYPAAVGDLVPSFLDSASTKWTVTYDGTGATAPTYAPIAPCV